MFKRIVAGMQSAQKQVGKRVQSAQERVQRAHRFLRMDLPIQTTRSLLKAVSLIQQGMLVVQDYVVVSCMTSSQIGPEELGALWDSQSDKDLRKYWGITEARMYQGPSSGESPSEVRMYQGSSSEDIPSQAVVVGTHKSMREKAAKLGQEKAQEYRQSLETARQERFKRLSEFLTEVLQRKIGPDVPLQDLILETCRVNLIAWQVAIDGGLDPMCALRELYPEEAPNEETARSVLSADAGVILSEDVQSLVHSAKNAKNAVKKGKYDKGKHD